VGYAPAGWKAKADDPKLAATQLESLTPGQAFRTRGYWHLFLGYGLFPTMYIICYPRFSVLISDAGYSLNAATIGVSIYSICNVIGRFGMGALIDKLGYRKVYTICGICSVASSLCLMFANSLAMFYIAYVLLAVGFGATNCCHPVAVQETYGSKYAGGIFGICMLGYMIICTFISPKISSALVKATGSYTASMIYAIIACIIAVIFYTTIPQPKRRTLAEVAAEEKAAQEKAAQA
jgi:OFA family oxalate/formate antiporter-like MFS transporter